MYRIDRTHVRTVALVEDALRAAGASEITRDDEGRLVGTKRAISATGQVVVDLAPAPDAEATFVSAVGRYTPRSQVPSLLGRTTPKWYREFRSTLEAAAGGDIRRL